MKNIEENNKLIAEFMGGILSSVPNIINLPQKRIDAHTLSVKGSEGLPNGTYSVHRISELKYHTSWDWLMPVVEKIELTHHYQEVEIRGNRCFFNSHSALDDCFTEWFEGETKKQATYKGVVEFIKWYNKNK